MKETIYSASVANEVNARKEKEFKSSKQAKKDRKSTLIGVLVLTAIVGLVLALNSMGLIHNV